MKTKWTTRSIYVDVDTGEVITKEEAIKAYVQIKQHKQVKFESHGSYELGITEFTNECRRSRQGTLFGSE